MESGMPDDVDIYVGKRVKLRRKLLGISQLELADALQLTFQQIQKYEKGANRISASKLYYMAKILDVPIAFFFDGIAVSEADHRSVGGEGPLSPLNANEIIDREVVSLVRAFLQIDRPAVRRYFIQLIESVSQPAEGAADL
jgi:transcriptional regulator with XRE-family HTH domain